MQVLPDALRLLVSEEGMCAALQLVVCPNNLVSLQCGTK